MHLKEMYININKVNFGDKTEIKQNTLTINKQELKSLIAEDSRLANIEIEIASPDDDCRIVRVADIIEPRFKLSGAGQVFPGVLSEMSLVGSGETICLKGVAVVETWQMAHEVPMIIDMSGPISQMSCFSQLHNIVLVAQPADNVDKHEYAAALKLASTKTSLYLAERGKNIQPDDEKIFDSTHIPEGAEKLPRVSYICQIYSVYNIAETMTYGHSSRGILPTIMNPNEFFDGAIVNNQYDNMSISETTYSYQNHPIIKNLYEHHGKDLIFTGVILRDAPVALIDKERTALFCAKLAKEYLHSDGVILTKEGGGHPQLDLDYTCRCCEEAGMKSSICLVEALSLASGGALSDVTLFNSKAADAIISCGMEERITINEAARVIGDALSPAEVRKEEQMSSAVDTSIFYDGGVISNYSIRGVLSQLGETIVTAREF